MIGYIIIPPTAIYVSAPTRENIPLVTNNVCVGCMILVCKYFFFFINFYVYIYLFLLLCMLFFFMYVCSVYVCRRNERDLP